MIASTMVVCVALLAAPSAWAQDDLDSLMESDRELSPGERHESADDEEGEDDDAMEMDDVDDLDHEAPPSGWQGESTKKVEEPQEIEEADDEVAHPISVALLVGYGISLEDANPWGAGFGLRGGYNVGDFFVGGRFVYYVGETITQTRASFGIGGPSTEEISTNVWELGAEVGYDIAIGDLTLRPGLGLGFAGVSAGDSSEVHAQIAPGLSILFAVSETMFIGLDARFQAIFSELGINGIPLLATVGMRF